MNIKVLDKWSKKSAGQDKKNRTVKVKMKLIISSNLY